MKKAINPILILGIVVLIILLSIEKCSKRGKEDKASLELIAALQDSVSYYKNKDSMNVATISVIQTASAKEFLRLQLKEQDLKKLQDIVSDYRKQLKEGSSVTNALLETVADLKGKPPTIIYQKGDTLWKDSIAYVHPTYKDTLQNKWIKLMATMNKDSSDFNITVLNEFSAVVGYHKKKPFVDLITENPYTTVKTLRTYQVKMPRPKKFGIGFSTGVTLNSDLKPAPYVGIGVNYNILRL